MPDREKVIRGLDLCQQGFACPSECPYLMDCNDLMKPMFVELAKDALALLKEQQEKGRLVDTTKVKTVQRIAKSEDNGMYFTIIWYECEECGQKINGDDIFCAGCGKEIDRSEVVWDA